MCVEFLPTAGSGPRIRYVRPIRKKNRYATHIYQIQSNGRAGASRPSGRLHFCRSADRKLARVRRLQSQNAFYTQAAATL